MVIFASECACSRRNLPWASFSREGPSPRAQLRPERFISLLPSLSISPTQRITVESVSASPVASFTAAAWSVQHSAGSRPKSFRASRLVSRWAYNSPRRGCQLLWARLRQPPYMPRTLSVRRSAASWYTLPPQPYGQKSATCSSGRSPEMAPTMSITARRMASQASRWMARCAATFSEVIGHCASFFSCCAKIPSGFCTSLAKWPRIQLNVPRNRRKAPMSSSSDQFLTSSRCRSHASLPSRPTISPSASMEGWASRSHDLSAPME